MVTRTINGGSAMSSPLVSFCLETARNRMNTGISRQGLNGILPEAYAWPTEKSRSRGGKNDAGVNRKTRRC